MQVQRIQKQNSVTQLFPQSTNKKNVHFGAQLDSITDVILRPHYNDISYDRFNCRVNSMNNWGNKDSIISYCLEGPNKDRFILTNPITKTEVAITKKTNGNNRLITFFDEINEEKIEKAEKALKDFSILTKIVKAKAYDCYDEGNIKGGDAILDILKSISILPITEEY